MRVGVSVQLGVRLLAQCEQVLHAGARGAVERVRARLALEEAGKLRDAIAKGTPVRRDLRHGAAGARALNWE